MICLATSFHLILKGKITGMSGKILIFSKKTLVGLISGLNGTGPIV